MSNSSLFCPYYDGGQCSSCGLLPSSYSAQLAQKEAELRSLFSGMPRAAAVPLEPIVPAASPFGSRYRAKMVVSGYAHAPLIGPADEGPEGRDILDCPLHHPAINEVLHAAKKLVQACGIPPYSVSRRKGELKFVFARHAARTGETMVRLVLRSRDGLDRAGKLWEALQRAVPHVKVFSVNIQPVHAAILEGDEEIILSERKFITEELGGTRLLYAPQSFSQVTPDVALQLYSYVAGLAVEARPEYVLDLFCGTGAFSLFCAEHAKKVLGVEVSAASVDVAKEAARLNGIGNVDFMAGDSAVVLDSLPSGVPDFVIVNPPRRGLSREIVAGIKRLKPRQIVYSSCNPETLRLNIAEFGDQYGLVSLRPFDMFPLTGHVEVAAVMKEKQTLNAAV